MRYMYLTRDQTLLVSMTYISINSLFTLIFLIEFALCDIFLPADQYSQQLTLGLIAVNCTTGCTPSHFATVKEMTQNDHK